MTDNEIIKALECCRDNDNNLNMEKCFEECPYDGECARKFMQDVLSLINRQKAEIKGLRDEVEHLHEGAECEADALYKATDIYNAIKSVPTADVVEVRHGKRIETQEPLGWCDVDCAECSVCHESWTINEDSSIDDCECMWHYCPNCGAKMDVKEVEGE